MNTKKTKKGYKKIFLMVIAMLSIIILLIGCGKNELNSDNNKEIRVYECDYKSLNLNTKITTTMNNEEITISGNIFRLLTDPLTVKNKDGEIIAYAGDVYGFISQDDHGIYIGEEFDVNMCGNIDLFGETYDLKNENGDIIGDVSFNTFNTYGTIKDIDDNIIAIYNSSYFFNDYTVTIYDNDVCSDLSILMIIGSYVSDYMADH